jgi:hypothetical protein
VLVIPVEGAPEDVRDVGVLLLVTESAVLEVTADNGLLVGALATMGVVAVVGIVADEVLERFKAV